MVFDATFWVAISFIIFFGVLIYLKVPLKINESLNKLIDDIKNELKESEKLRKETKEFLDQSQSRLNSASDETKVIMENAKKDADAMVQQMRDKFNKSAEINSFDQGNGHPAPIAPGQENGTDGRYHYHMEPILTSKENGRNVILGFLLDGFPVYGPEENGDVITSSSLDDYHGHSHATTDFPAGIYHYHLTADDPYLNGSGYYGTPGTVSQ